MLGDLIARLEDETVAAEALLSLDDLPLVARVVKASANAGLPSGAYAAAAVGRFVTEADDQEWLSLIGLMTRDADPSGAFLRRALAKELGPLETGQARRSVT
jgi:hypothetical protein